MSPGSFNHDGCVCTLALLPEISAVCVLAATQGGPSSPTEQFVNWQPNDRTTGQLAGGPIVCNASRVVFDVSPYRSQTTVENCIGGHVNVLFDYKKT